MTLLALLSALALAGEQYVPLQITTFEDVNVEGQSDEDANDVTVVWEAKCDRTASGVVRQTISLSAVAAGARQTNALWLVPPAPATATLSVDLAAPAPLTPEPGGHLVLFDDFRQAFRGSPTGFVNTEGGTVVEGLPVQVVLEFDAPQPFGGACPAAEFAVAGPNALIGMDSTIGDNQRPLSGSFDATWAVPTERTSIATSYPRFLDWVTDLLDGTCDTECASPLWFDEPDVGRVVPRPELASGASLPPFDTCADAAPGLACGDPDGVCPPCGVYVLASGGTRTWSDGTYAASCEGYRYPTGGESFAGADATSGTYTIDPLGGDPFQVWCDMDFDGGGWTKVMTYGPVGTGDMSTTDAVARDGAWTTQATGTSTGKVSQAEWKALWDATEFVVRVADPSDGILMADGAGYLAWTATNGTRFPDWGTGYRAQYYDLACDRTGDGVVDQTISFTPSADPDCGHGQYWVWDHDHGTQCFGTTSSGMTTNVHFCGDGVSASLGGVTGVHSVYVRGTPSRLALVGGARRWDDGSVARSCEAYRRPPDGYVYDGPHAASGVYTIDPIGGSPFQVWCDMEFDGGGWTKVLSYGPSTDMSSAAAVAPGGAWTTGPRGTATGKVSNAAWQALWSNTEFLMRVENPSDGKFIGGGVGHLLWTANGTPFSEWGTGQRPTNYTLSCDKDGDGLPDETRNYGTAADTCSYGTYWLWDHFPGDQCFGTTSSTMTTNIHFCGTLSAQSDGGVTGTHHIYVRD